MQNPPPIKSTHPQKSKQKCRLSKRQRQRRRNKQKLLINNQNQNKSQSHSHFPSRRGSSQIQNGADVWRKAYENAVRWHGEHQSSFWRHAAENLQRENQMLRQQIISNRAEYPKQDFYETSGSDDEDEKQTISIKKETDEENNGIDVQYLEFLQITFKHREEMRLKRQAEEQEAVDIPPDLPEKIA